LRVSSTCSPSTVAHLYSYAMSHDTSHVRGPIVDWQRQPQRRNLRATVEAG